MRAQALECRLRDDLIGQQLKQPAATKAAA
jgi:hypothetical protein